MNLADHQRALLGLIRDNYDPDAEDDPYIRRVATSPDLAEARGNIVFWRLYVLERTCRLTVELLKRRRALLPTLQAFMRASNVSPFREFQPFAFLAFLRAETDPLLVSVSQFEMALIRIREGDSASHVVEWTREPRAVLMALAQNGPLDETGEVGEYRTRISRDLPFQFETEAVSMV